MVAALKFELVSCEMLFVLKRLCPGVLKEGVFWGGKRVSRTREP